ncbi:MAG: GNAT family N-acetyltransferase [Ruminococcaceae bacterium]|nr:GNAT family N-acetyltransferase [Oscillospiraceae bacterium]
MFKIYNSGKEFIEENREIFDKYPLETVFYEANANAMYDDMSNGFAVKAYDENGFMLAIRNLHFPMVLFGDSRFCGELAEELYRNNLTFTKLVDTGGHADAFFESYEKAAGGTHKLSLKMDIMKCHSLKDVDTSEIKAVDLSNAEEIAELNVEFSKEALNEEYDYNYALERVKSQIADYSVIFRDGRIAAIAKKTRETDRLCGISFVYTRREYRGQGFARKVVAFITKSILDSGKLPYLYVNKSNPVSNHLYLSMGFEYVNPQTEYKYISDGKQEE